MEIKKHLVLLFAFFLCLGINAQNEFRLGYCDHEITSSTSGEGADTAGEISAAIYLPYSKIKTLVGNDITRIDVGMISRINVRDLTVWVRHSLDGENLAEAYVERNVAGWNELTLNTPYTIKAEDTGLYVGYTFTNKGSSHPVSFVGTGTPGTSFFKSSAAGNWYDMESKGNLSLEAIVSGSNLPQYDLTLNSVSISPNLSLGSNGYSVSGEVSNVALSDVRSFQLTISADGVQNSVVDVNTTVKSGATIRFTKNFTAKGALSGEVTVTISKLTGGTDANMDDNTQKTSVSFLRNVLVEEFTTERCPNCPTAANALHQALESNAMYDTRIITVCHHAGFSTDWLTRSCDTDLLSLYNDGGSTFAPAFMFDRQSIYDSMLSPGQKDNVVGINQKADFIECFGNAFAIPTHAMLGINVLEAKQNGTGATVTVQVTVMCDEMCDLANPILTVYATEDNIKARNQEGASGEFYHQSVIRWDNGSWGDAVNFTNNTFTKTYTINIAEDWNTAKMKIVAFVGNRNADNILDNHVENAAAIACPVIQTGITDEPITDQPQGEVMKDVEWFSNAAYPNNGKVEWTEVSGFVPTIVTNGNKMYIYSPITQLSDIAKAWIVGDISEDGATVTFHTPQPYMINNGSNGPETLYATRLTNEGKLDKANTDLVFSYQNGELQQTDGGVLALTNLDGGFYGYADTNIKVTRITEQVAVLPADAVVESYLMQSGTGNNVSKQTAQIAFCGDEVYISDPLGIENSWFKGTRNGNTISVPTHQYIGTGSGYPMYVNSGEKYTYTQTDPLGQQQVVTSYRLLNDEAILFTYDEATGVLSTNQLLLINAGKNTLGAAYVGYEKPQYTPWTQTPATPANPSIDQFVDLDPYFSYGMKGCLMALNVPAHDVNGEFIAQEDLYYMVYFDDQPVEIYGATAIPYYGTVSDANLGLYITFSGDVHQFQFGTKPRNTVGIQSLYVVGNDYYASELVSYNIVDGELVSAGIEEIAADDNEIERVNFYDITGRKVDLASAKGVIIKETVYKDGRKNSVKINKR